MSEAGQGSMNEMSDQELIAQAKAGNEQAFAMLWQSHYKTVRCCVSRWLGPNRSEEIDDVLGDTYLKSWQGMKDFRGEASVCTWFIAIARSVTLQPRRLRWGAVVRAGLPGDATWPNGSAVESGPGPEDLIVSRAEADALKALLLRMKPAQQKALRRKFPEVFGETEPYPDRPRRSDKENNQISRAWKNYQELARELLDRLGRGGL